MTCTKALLFYIHDNRKILKTLIETNIFQANWNKGVVFWRSQVKPRRHEKQTLTFSHDAFSTWEQTTTPSKYPSASIKNEQNR